MILDEQIIEIENYCREHGVTREQRIKETGIDRNQYYRIKKKLIEENNNLTSGKFLQLSSTGEIFQQGEMFPIKKKKSSKSTPASASYLTIEIRNEKGAAMRIQGELGAEQLREIMSVM
jgi:hypothetical protein